MCAAVGIPHADGALGANISKNVGEPKVIDGPPSVQTADFKISQQLSVNMSLQHRLNQALSPTSLVFCGQTKWMQLFPVQMT